MDGKDLLLWQDKALLVINKPAGLLTIRDGYDPTLPYLTKILEETFGKVWVVHRLDKDTSGIMLFARSADAHRDLNKQFEKHEIQKVYHAIVVGMPTWEELNVSLPLRINGDRKHRTVVDPQRGKPAQTVFQVMQRLGPFTLVAALPKTGYTHQIRAHLSVTGFPILADPLYKSLDPPTLLDKRASTVEEDLPIQRLALHAAQITFRHPLKGNIVTMLAPYPDDFQQTLDALSAQASQSPQ